ncbi:glycoside hydrolase family 6 protein [Streptantibioticus ferralitis]|uniref:Glucanase n=1 Tax=Streptantibioticus ferralitis TaxID=236510 RepID=A0ABT5YTR9_9ACTN|nr:glycoside hydrolase family 6 protein [Streptantibioticus ferralitis]MDF2254853.1 glycoside hydrolase family 6 protein [Streptantibioticus ferralitis]
MRLSARYTTSACIAAALLGVQGLLTPWSTAAGGPLVVPLDQPASGPGSPFWVDPQNRADEQAAVWQERGREDDADLLRRIADQPTATWLGEGDPEERARQVTMQAQLAQRVPVLVAYNIPHRDCGQYSAGGAADGAAYRAWVDKLADGIENRTAWVVLEPDAVAQLVTCPASQGDGERLALLAYAVRTLKARPNTSVYLDAGNAGWIRNPEQLADALRKADIEHADGFALNVSNFQTTRASGVYGHRLSALLGGAHFVIDTSRNGGGPLRRSAGTEPEGAQPWCNPPNRALGRPPTTATGDRQVDAYLWVKRPGESDGACRGGPPAGQWWPDYALQLARRSGDWPSVSEHEPSGPVMESPAGR